MRGNGQATVVVQGAGENPGIGAILGGTLLSLVVAFVVAVLVGLIGRAPPASPVQQTAEPNPPVHLPVLVTPSTPAVTAEPDRAVPHSVEASADVTAAPWAPGLVLKDTLRARRWDDHRAHIADATNGDLRAYAIGDLLPHGSLLVGISTGAVDVLVADRELIRLSVQGDLRSVEDFRTADEARPLARAPALDPAYVAGADDTLFATRSDDPLIVQAAIDELITAGEPVVDLILPSADSVVEVPAVEFAFPSPDGPRQVPQVQGDIVIGVLEAVTGESFGDVFEPGITPARRYEIARKWKRWWGLE